MAGGTCVQTLTGHGDWVMAVAFSADGKQLASGSADAIVKIWDTATGMCVHTLEGHTARVAVVAFSSDGRQVASGSDDKTVRIWDPAVGVCLQTLPVGAAVTQLSFGKEQRACLYTNLGILQLDRPPPVSATAVVCAGYGVNEAGSWITRDGKPLLWLPSEYRPLSLAVVGSTVVLGSKAGRVLALQLRTE
ncbi:WD40-repeat-containing domain protein [Trichoderma austrokoningii]